MTGRITVPLADGYVKEMDRWVAEGRCIRLPDEEQHGTMYAVYVSKPSESSHKPTEAP